MDRQGLWVGRPLRLTEPAEITPLGMHTQGRGLLIVMEGADGAGKSTLVQSLVAQLRDEGVRVGSCSFPGRLDGTLGRHIYELHHHHPRFGIARITPEALQLLHVAAHVDAIRARIQPALESGAWVVLDRFWWSTWVYGRLAGLEADALCAILAPEWYVLAGICPHHTFVIERSRRPAELGGCDPAIQAAYRQFIAQPIPGVPALGPISVIENHGTLADATSEMMKALR